jgi:iron complex transport system ATP-binding protein
VVAVTGPSSIACTGVSVEVPGRTLVRDLDLAVPAGRLLVVLGRNGCGKSSTLHTLAGLRPPARGVVHLGGRRLEDWPRRDLACTLGLLPQLVEDPFPATALEAVLVGRHPHLDFWAWESADDRAAAQHALASRPSWRRIPRFSCWTSRSTSSIRRTSSTCCGCSARWPTAAVR